jgi:hypothetical protein
MENGFVLLIEAKEENGRGWRATPDRENLAPASPILVKPPPKTSPSTPKLIDDIGD